MNYSKAAVGGTFDHFHLGHQELLKTASHTASQLVIGITDQNLIQTKTDAHLIEQYQHRYQSVASWLNQNNLESTATIVKLIDPFGPTLTDPSIDSLVVSSVTKVGANQLNQVRVDKNLIPLPVIITPMVLDETDDYISSTKIRQGLITRNGRVTQKLFDHDYVFSDTQLAELSHPQGQVFQPESLISNSKQFTNSNVYLVGDMVTQFFQSQNLNFSTAIIDGQTKRTPLKTPLKPSMVLAGHNSPGTINHQLAQELISHLDKDNTQTIYQIDGEEDLLAFIPSLTRPLGSLVLYGQPDGGIVMITLTEEVKLRFGRILDPSFN